MKNIIFNFTLLLSLILGLNGCGEDNSEPKLSITKKNTSNTSFPYFECIITSRSNNLKIEK